MVRSGASALAIVVTVLLAAAPAHATVYGVTPANGDGPNDAFATNEALWAVGTSNPLEGIGQLCVVDEFSSASDCKEDGVWGSPNAIATTGTFLQPITSAGMPTGTYRILADNGDDGQDILSVPFTVTGCTAEDCSTAIADAELRQWKAAAARTLDGPAAACLATTVLERDAEDLVAGALSGSSRGFVVAQLRDGSGLGLEFDLPASSAAGAMSLLQHVSCNAWLAYSDIVSDPPDPAFEQLSAPRVQELPTSSSTEAGAAAGALELLRANAVAQRIASERYQGAVLAGDAGWSSAQAGSVAETGFGLGKGMRRSVDPLRAFATGLDGDLSVAAATPGDLEVARGVRNRIRTLGFRADELDALAGLGQTPEDIVSLRAQMGAPLPPGTGGIHPADALRRQADALEAASCHAPGSSCAFDDFARLAGAVAGNTHVPPRIEVADVTLREGDRGRNHVHVGLRLSHPPSGEVRVNVAPTEGGAMPEGVTVSGVGGVVFDGQRLRAVLGIEVVNDDVPGPTRTFALDVQPTGPAVGPVAPVTVTVTDDDASPAPRSGARGRLAFADEGGSIFVAERSGSDVHAVSDGLQADRRGLIDWSADGRFMLMHRPSSVNGPNPVYLLPVGPDARPTGPEFPVTPEAGQHEGPSLTRDSRRLVSARRYGFGYQLVVQALGTDGRPEGTEVELLNDPQLANISFADEPSWSPDGAHIAFRGCGPAFSVCDGIYVLDITPDGDVTGPARALAAPPSGSRFLYPSWSPDGRFVAYSAYRPYETTQFAVERVPVSAAGTVNGPRAVLAARRSELPARWSYDSRAVALTLVEHPLSDSVIRSRVVVDLDDQARATGTPTLIAPLSISGPLHMVWGPRVADVRAPATTLAVAPAANPAGWHRDAVTLTLRATDDPDGDGVASIAYDVATGSGPPGPPTVTGGDRAVLTLTEDGVHRVRYGATDRAGNREAQRELVVRVDRTAPTISVGAPTDGAVHAVGAAAAAAFGCADATSGVLACAGTTPDGGRLETGTAGAREFGVEAADLAGNTASAGRRWRVEAPALVPQPRPATTTAPAPVAAKVVAAATLPSNRVCVSRRRFRIKLARPPGDPLVRADVRIGTRRVRTLRGRSLVAPVDLRGLPRGRFTVTVTAVTKRGKRLTTRRAYRTCASRSTATR